MHAICGTDCESPCTKEFETEGRDWRNFQDWRDDDEVLTPDTDEVRDGGGEK